MRYALEGATAVCSGAPLPSYEHPAETVLALILLSLWTPPPSPKSSSAENSESWNDTRWMWSSVACRIAREISDSSLDTDTTSLLRMCQNVHLAIGILRPNGLGLTPDSVELPPSWSETLSNSGSEEEGTHDICIEDRRTRERLQSEAVHLIAHFLSMIPSSEESRGLQPKAESDKLLKSTVERMGAIDEQMGVLATRACISRVSLSAFG